MRISHEIIDDEVYIDIELFPKEMEELEDRKMIFTYFKMQNIQFNIGFKLNLYEEE